MAEPPLSEQRRECAELVPFDALNILDLGCGDGGFGWWLKQRVHLQVTGPKRVRVTGIDVHSTGGAARRLDAFHVHDLDDTSAPTLHHLLRSTFPRPGYDCVTALDVLEHLRDPGYLLGEVWRVLRPGGTLVVSVPNVRNAGVLHDLLHHGRFEYGHGDQGPVLNIKNSDHLRFFARADLLQLLEEHGYEVLRVDATHMTMPDHLTLWTGQVAHLLAQWGDDAEAWKASASVVQWLIQAKRPEGRPA